MATEQGYKYYTKGEIDEILGGVYSTNEVACGKWIDSSIIYKKTIVFGYLPNATSKSIAHRISNLGQIIKIEGIASNGTRQFALDRPAGADGTYYIRLHFDATNITATSDQDRSEFEAFITLYYTKNT